MLSSHFESMQWNETTTAYIDELWDMKFLDVDPAESLFPNFEAFDSGNMDFSDLVAAPSSDTKYQIRHHDCMWSGTCVDKSHPSKKKGLNLCMAQQSQQQSSTQQQQQQQQSDNVITKLDATTNAAVKVVTQKTIMTPNNIMKTIMCKNGNSTSSCSVSNTKLSSNGRSLLISNNNNNNNLNSNQRINTNTAALTQKIQNTSKCIESISSRHSNSYNHHHNHEFDSIMNASLTSIRPDTPLSLGDDVPEFKHNIDLTPCPSSNRMKFNDPNSIKIINALAEHLEETSNSLNDPINPLFNGFRNRSTPSDLNEILTDITFLSDYEDLADDSSIIDMDDDDQLDEHDYKSKLFATNLMSQASTSSSSSSSTMGRTTINHHEFISDHSYTRPKGSRYDPIALGVQTPSDSGEFILLVLITYLLKFQIKWEKN